MLAGAVVRLHAQDTYARLTAGSKNQRRVGLLGSDANFIAMQSIAPGGRAKGTMNLDSDPNNPTVWLVNPV